MLHWAILTTTDSPKKEVVDSLLHGPFPDELRILKNKKGGLFSGTEIAHYIDEEVRHDRKILTANTSQSLQSMSSGERKKALLSYLIASKPDYLILDNPFDNLDTNSKKALLKELLLLKSSVHIIQILSRKTDLLPFIDNIASLQNNAMEWHGSLEELAIAASKNPGEFTGALPPPLHQYSYPHKKLIELQNISVSYGTKPVLQNINWCIRPGEFWELKGKNGSGKTTILSMVTGDNPKGYGQDLYLFGHKKGSGESVWDIKKQIGYVTPALTDRFRGYHTLQNMLISGLVDSIGLYIEPTESQRNLAAKWLALLGMEHQKNNYFHELSKGEQRLIMCARAMIKHPLLLLLDEPTSDLDDRAANLVVALVNKIAQESNSTIIFVSHRNEPQLQPQFVYELQAASTGSMGIVLT
ncbi:MAG: ATP-binding cassette domain-containing protein [Muriicola sp.]|nr:ATP-binding cassette domain-containing protein [Muriicola sp.]